MSLTNTRAQDHYLMNGGENVVPCVPKAGYASSTTAPPTKGHLVVFDGTLADDVDLTANGETPVGIVESTNNGNGTLSVALFTSGGSIILPQDGSCVLGHSVQSTDTTTASNAIGTGGIARTVVKDAAAGAGLGVIRALNPRGTNTVEVFFP